MHSAGATWDKLYERRTYSAATEGEAAAACRAGMEEALAQGYLPESVAWSSDGLEVTVDYVYDPARAGRSV